MISGSVTKRTSTSRRISSRETIPTPVRRWVSLDSRPTRTIPAFRIFPSPAYVAIGGQNMDSSNWRRPSSTVQFTDVFNYTAGAAQHRPRAGNCSASLRETRATMASAEPLRSRARLPANAAADFLLGFPRNVTTPAPANVQVSARQWRNAFFVSDKWTVSPKLDPHHRAQV